MANRLEILGRPLIRWLDFYGADLPMGTVQVFDDGGGEWRCMWWTPRTSADGIEIATGIDEFECARNATKKLRAIIRAVRRQEDSDGQG